MKGKLIIVRHQESEWNKLGKWTGARDIHLTDQGFIESESLGLLIKDLNIDCAFASMEVRTIETLSCILNVCKKYKVPTEHSSALNERDYGDYTGKNKFEMEAILGGEEFKKLRRGWDYSIPNGESLKMVYERVIPFFIENVLPKVVEGKNVLIVAHGNSLRALVKYIENIGDEEIADLEIPFASVLMYDLDKDGHSLHKEIRKKDEHVLDQKKLTQIIATIGPASAEEDVLDSMIKEGLDVARLNFSFGEVQLKLTAVQLIRKLGNINNKKITIIADLPGPRIQQNVGHTFDRNALSSITDADKNFIKFAAENNLDYVAVSFVGSELDIIECKKIISEFSGTQKIIAKIERKEAMENLENIVNEADAVMVARGDLGNEFPIEEVPFLQERIVKVCKDLSKPVIIATQMLFSMTENPAPTRAEVTDVEIAVSEGADAVMLSEETAKGKYPVDAVKVMKKLINEAEKHLKINKNVNTL